MSLHDHHLAEYECQTKYLQSIPLAQYIWITRTTGTIVYVFWII